MPKQKEKHERDYWEWARLYNKCMETLEDIDVRWCGSAYNVNHSRIQHLYDLIDSGKTSFTRYKREMNDYIYFKTYGEHLYKSMVGKDLNTYIL